jgi:hypothetical protein
MALVGLNSIFMMGPSRRWHGPVDGLLRRHQANRPRISIVGEKDNGDVVKEWAREDKEGLRVWWSV